MVVKREECTDKGKGLLRDMGDEPKVGRKRSVESRSSSGEKAEQYHRQNRIPQNDMVSSVSSLDSGYKPEYQQDNNAKESTVTDGRSQEINPTFRTRSHALS